MNAKLEPLARPPIIEMVLDVDCNFRPGQRFNDLEQVAGEKYRSSYPKSRKHILQEVQFLKENVAAAEPAVRTQQRIQAFQFLNQDENQLVQVREQGYSFNKLSPYTTLDDYFGEIEETWATYCLIADPLQIRAVRLRYINRILLPLADGKCDLDRYLQDTPKLPADGRLALAGFVVQRAAVEVETDHKVNIVLTAQAPLPDKLPIILDICVTDQQAIDTTDWTCIRQKVHGIREECNWIFKGSVTEQCLNLFQ